MIQYKYNPGFSLDSDLLKSFAVRHRDLDIILRVISENSAALFNKHVLIVGARGLGKTTLVRVIAATVRSNLEYGNTWYPIVFGEESYAVGSAGEFWLECIYHILNQEADAELQKLYSDLRAETDEEFLREKCLHVLSSFSRERDRRLLIIVENLNSLFDGQLSEDDGWAIRHTLQTSPDMMVVATATTNFGQVEEADNAFFGQFKVHYLSPLDQRDCRKLWERVSGQEITDRKIRPVQILTGGNPRLIRIWAEFVMEKSFRNTIDKLGNIIDEYTDYFKGQLDGLAPGERRIFAALLELWDPSTTRDVAEHARLPINTTSTLLSRLQKHGMVLRSGKVPPTWYAAERLFNIYYLMRRRGTASSRVQALVRFMTVYYQGEQLVERTTELAQEACSLEPELRLDHYAAFAHLVEQLDIRTRELLLERVPGEFFSAQDLPANIKAIQTAIGKSLVAADEHSTASEKGLEQVLVAAHRLIDEGRGYEARELIRSWEEQHDSSYLSQLALAMAATSEGELDAAEAYARAAIEINETDSTGWFLLGIILRTKRDARQSAIEALRRAAGLAPNDGVVWQALGSLLAKSKSTREEGCLALRKATRLIPADPDTWAYLGDTLDRLGRYREAEIAFRKAINLSSAGVMAWGLWGDYLMRRKHDLASAEEAFRKVLELDPDSIKGRLRLAVVASHFPERAPEVRKLYNEAIDLSGGDNVTSYLRYSDYLIHLGEADESERLLRRAAEVAPENPDIWLKLSETLEARNAAPDEVEPILRKAIEVSHQPGPYWEALAVFLEKQPSRQAEVEETLQKARMAAPEACTLLHFLGSFYAKQGRVADAETAFRSAIQVNPGCACAVLSLADCLKDASDRPSELTTIVEEVLKRDPNNSAAHFILGKQLWVLNHDFSGAQNELMRALQAGGAATDIWTELTSLILNSQRDSDKCQRLLLSALRKMGNLSLAINIVARQIYKLKRMELMTFARNLAGQAVRSNPELWAYRHTLVSILIELREFEQALPQIGKMAEDISDNQLRSFIELCTAFAQTGDIVELISIIEHSKSAKLFEPLLTALRMVQGDIVEVAEEVRQVADDLVLQIKTRLPAVEATVH